MARGHEPVIIRAWGSLLRVTPGMEKTVVFVGRGDETQFVAGGTGFLAAHTSGDVVYQTVITARHVLDKMGDVQQVGIRVNTQQGGAKVIQTPRKRWMNHPDDRIDVSVCPILLMPDMYDCLVISLDNVLSDQLVQEHKIGVGEDV